MNWIGITVGLTVLLTIGSASALQVEPDLVVGEEHEIIVSYRTASQESNGSSGSSQGSDTLLERVIALSDAGLELQFDLPSDATAEDRARVWQYPARVVQMPNGSMELLNGPELDERVDQWLTRADLTREMCGRWVFTWNAFRIECDPSSVVADLQAINLLSVDLRDGAVYEHPGALGSAPLCRRADGKGGSTYTVKLDADADAVRRSRAEGDVAVGEIMQQPVTLETALSNRSAEAVSGTVEITFNVDPSGRPIRRVVTTTLETEEPGNVTRTETQTVTVERKPV